MNNKIVKYYGLFILIIFLIIFPFGQLFRYEVLLAGINLSIQLIDVLVVFSLPYLFFYKKQKYNILQMKYATLIFVFITSWIFSAIDIEAFNMVRGLLYLVRVVSYFSFSLLVSCCTDSDRVSYIFRLFQLSIFIFMVIGLYQFIKYYDLRDLKYLGWDDHYFRLTSTLFDPGQTVVVLITGLILFLKKKISNIKILNVSILLLFMISIILTFSRSGYLAFIVIMLLMYKKHMFKIFTLALLSFILIVIIPKPHSSGVELLRTFSIVSRINNYATSVPIFFNKPLFGIGFNNMCYYKTEVLGIDNVNSHSCSGSDSSLLLLAVTSGIIGLFVYFEMLVSIFLVRQNNQYFNLFFLIYVVIFINAFFNNSLFYNFNMGMMALLMGLSKKV